MPMTKDEMIDELSMLRLDQLSHRSERVRA
jgi:hypothetical protein